MRYCLTCGVELDPDWLDIYCATPCLDRVYEALATQLLEAFLSRYRGAILHRRMPTGERRWWLRRSGSRARRHNGCDRVRSF